MSSMNGTVIDHDDPRLAGMSARGVGSPSGFTHLAEAAPDRPSNRRLVSMGLLTILLALVLAQGAYFGSGLLTAEYRARAEVQYRGSAWTETQNVAIQSRSLTQPVADRFGIPIKDFEENLDAGLVSGTQVLKVDYVSSDRDQARAIVGAIAADYIAEISEVPSVEASVVLQRELENATAQLEAAQADLRRLAPLNTDEARVEQQTTQQLTNSLNQRINDLQSRILDAELSSLDTEARGLPEVITEPFVFEDPVFPRPRLFAAIGFIVGLVIGAVVIATKWNTTAWASIDADTKKESA